jgi:hypothetical protein
MCERDASRLLNAVNGVASETPRADGASAVDGGILSLYQDSVGTGQDSS